MSQDLRVVGRLENGRGIEPLLVVPAEQAQETTKLCAPLVEPPTPSGIPPASAKLGVAGPAYSVVGLRALTAENPEKVFASWNQLSSRDFEKDPLGYLQSFLPSCFSDGSPVPRDAINDSKVVVRCIRLGTGISPEQRAARLQEICDAGTDRTKPGQGFHIHGYGQPGGSAESPNDTLCAFNGPALRNVASYFKRGETPPMIFGGRPQAILLFDASTDAGLSYQGQYDFVFKNAEQKPAALLAVIELTQT